MTLEEKIEQLQAQLFTQRPAVAFDAELLEEVIQRAKRVAATNRIGGVFDRFPEQLLLDKSGHAFVGHGILDNVSLLSGGDTDNVLTIYDTDHADTTYGPAKLILKNLTANETPVDPAGVPINLTRGCYVQLSGTDPRAMLSIRRAVGYGSEGALRDHATRATS